MRSKIEVARSRPPPCASSTECIRPSALQVGVVQRLHAERDAVDAGGAVAAQARRPRRWSGWLPASLRTSGATLQFAAMASRTAPTVSGFISDGVPPPRKMLVTVRPGAIAAWCAISRAKAAAIARLVHPRVADMAVEVAVRAFRRAERPMDIDPEPRVEGQMGRSWGLFERSTGLWQAQRWCTRRGKRGKSAPEPGSRPLAGRDVSLFLA